MLPGDAGFTRQAPCVASRPCAETLRLHTPPNQAVWRRDRPRVALLHREPAIHLTYSTEHRH